jgi:hypothetical protein
MRRATWILSVLIGCGLGATHAIAADLATQLDQLGFVPGKSSSMCIEPSYVVERSGDRLSVRRATSADERFSIDRPSVTFVGKRFRYESEDRGEFGGKLDLVASDGTRRKILAGNVRSLLPVEGDLYVFEGLNHLDPTGSVHVIRKFDVEPRIERVTLLTDTPVFVTLRQRPPGQHWFWIVGTNSLTELVDEWGILKIHPFGDIFVSDFATLVDRGAMSSLVPAAGSSRFS